MSYRTVFDVTAVGFQWWYPFLACIFSGVFILIGWAVKFQAGRRERSKGNLFQVIGGIGVCFAVLFFIAGFIEYRKAKRVLTTRQFSVAEGVVTDFVPMPAGGHSIESFTISGKRFAYGAGWGSTTFNSEWNRGFIYNGVQARITYHGDDILRVEIKSTNVP